jgi:hypothetical protein
MAGDTLGVALNALCTETGADECAEAGNGGGIETDSRVARTSGNGIDEGSRRGGGGGVPVRGASAERWGTACALVSGGMRRSFAWQK